MKKRLLEALTAGVMALSLAGCTLPGEQAADNDFYNGDLDYNEAVDVSDAQAVNYAWSLKPTVSAENIIVFDGSQVEASPTDPNYNQMYTRVAVICRGGQYGLMDYKGNLLAQPAYKYYMLDPYGQVVLYNITDEKNDVREFLTMDVDGHVTTDYAMKSSTKVKYYYDVDNKKTYVAKEAEDWKASVYTDSRAVVAEKADVSEEFGRIEVIESESADKLYGLVSGNKVLLDFEYTGFYSPNGKGAADTCIALEKDGKWGYFDNKGEQVMDFKCDEILSSYNGEISDSVESGHPYLFSEDIVPVSINFSFGYYNESGKCLVRSSEFSQARPVHHGKAWVCMNGMWGVIRFGEEDPDDAWTTTTTTTTTTTYQTWWTAATSSEDEEGGESEWVDPDQTSGEWVDPGYPDPSTEPYYPDPEPYPEPTPAPDPAPSPDPVPVPDPTQGW